MNGTGRCCRWSPQQQSPGTVGGCETRRCTGAARVRGRCMPGSAAECRVLLSHTQTGGNAKRGVRRTRLARSSAPGAEVSLGDGFHYGLRRQAARGPQAPAHHCALSPWVPRGGASCGKRGGAPAGLRGCAQQRRAPWLTALWCVRRCWGSEVEGPTSTQIGFFGFVFLSLFAPSGISGHALSST
jgi:hypothetical protein